MKSFGSGMLANFPVLRDVKRRRISSHDPRNGNRDYRIMGQGERLVIVDIKGSGCIRHIWMTLSAREDGWARKVVFAHGGTDRSSPR